MYFFWNKVFGGGVLKFNEKSPSVIIGVVIMMHEKKSVRVSEMNKYSGQTRN